MPLNAREQKIFDAIEEPDFYAGMFAILLHRYHLKLVNGQIDDEWFAQASDEVYRDIEAYNEEGS